MTELQSKDFSVVSPNTTLQTASSQALVQRTLAEVQVAVMMAKMYPRNKIAVRDKLIIDCCREDLAEVAVYSYVRGGKEITGATIRFAEAAKNAWGNMQSGWRELSRVNGISEIEAFAWDAENNTRESVIFSVKHWRDTKKGGYALTDERDIYELCANQAKRRERACILAKIDGDIVAAGLKQCDTTLSAAKPTADLIKSMIDNFQGYGVTQEMIEKRIQRRLESINGALIASLKKIYASLYNGMSKPEDWFEFEVAQDAHAKGTQAVKETLKKESKAKTEKAEPEKQSPPMDVQNDNSEEWNDVIKFPDGKSFRFPQEVDTVGLGKELQNMFPGDEGNFIRENKNTWPFVMKHMREDGKEAAAKNIESLIAKYQ